MIDAREQVVRFLTSLAQASSALTLYEREHPAVERAIEIAFEHVLALQETEPRPVLTFLGEEVVFGSVPIKSLSAWEWGRRLAEIGVQRFECHGPVTRADFDGFVDRLFGRITGTDSGDLVPDETSSIRFGLVGVGTSGSSLSQFGSSVGGYALAEEIAALKWVDDEVRAGGKLQMVEVHTVVRSLAIAMHADAEMMIPLVNLKGYDQYTTTHSLNISVLSMALGEFIGLSSTDVRRLGVAGLLHDIGKTQVPKELLNKSGKLTDEEFAAIQRHPFEGARLLMQREANLDLAATVAYEHHIRFDGGGYPDLKYRRPCHPASDLVHLCDVYDALRTHRPYRKAWGQERVLTYIEESLGTEFNPKLGQAFLEMMHRWGSRLHRITAREDAVPIGQPDRPVEMKTEVDETAKAAPPSQKVRPKKPAATKPASKKPAAKKPVAKKPVAKRPVAKKRVAAKPAAMKRVAAKPANKAKPAKPSMAKPSMAKSATTKRATTKLATTKRATTKPATAKPTKPTTMTKRVVAKPAPKRAIRKPEEVAPRQPAEAVQAATTETEAAVTDAPKKKKRRTKSSRKRSKASRSARRRKARKAAKQATLNATASGEGDPSKAKPAAIPTEPTANPTEPVAYPTEPTANDDTLLDDLAAFAEEYAPEDSDGPRRARSVSTVARDGE